MAANKISFAEDVKSPTILTPETADERSARKMSGSSDDHRLRRLSSGGSSIPEDAIFDPSDPTDRLHKQDWSKTTQDKDSWAHQERRRMHGWSNTDVANYKQWQGRRGSVLSMWAPGKDKQGNDVLMHNDDREKDDSRSESGRSEGSAVNGSNGSNGSTLMPSSPKEGFRRGSNLSDRRGSVLSMWKGSKDKAGNDIMGGDDEEWAR